MSDSNRLNLNSLLWFVTKVTGTVTGQVSSS